MTYILNGREFKPMGNNLFTYPINDGQFSITLSKEELLALGAIPKEEDQEEIKMPALMIDNETIAVKSITFTHWVKQVTNHITKLERRERE